jgi:hypothetical protein
MSSRRSKGSSHSSRSSQSKQSKSTNPTSNSTSATNKTKGSGGRSSAYGADFEQHLIDHGIYINSRKSKPSNLHEIRQILAQLRPSLSPSRFSEGAFEEFQQGNEDVIDEGEVMSTILPEIHGKRPDILNKKNLLFTRLKSITNGITVDTQPDFYDGASLDSLDKQVQKDLRQYIIPTKHRTAPVVPNFFLEAKAPKGGADVAKRQACHDGAIGARAIHELQSYAAGKPVYDNNAYTITATYHNGNLNSYVTHVTPSGPGGSPEYHMTQVGSLSLTHSRERYLEGATYLRNARELAKEWRDQFILAANERARSMNADESTLSSSNYSRPSRTTYLAEESETSPDEFAATSFPNRAEEPVPSEDELAASYPIATSFSYYREGPETSEYEPGDTSFYPGGEPEPSEDELAASFSQPVTASFSHTAKRRSYNSLSNIIEESETSVDEVAKNSTSTKKRPSKGSKKTVSKAPRQSTSGRGGRSKK